MPRPKKLNVATVRMAVPNRKLASTRFQRQDLATYNSRETGHRENTDGHHHVRITHAQDSDHHDRQQQLWKCQQQVEQSHRRVDDLALAKLRHLQHGVLVVRVVERLAYRLIVERCALVGRPEVH